MNAFTMARTAYSPAHTPVRSAKSIEYEAFARVTRDIRNASKDDPDEFPRLVEALQKNRELWTVMAVSVADNDNALPASLRAQIFYLSEFTSIQTSRILRKEASADILIEVNTAIMTGLRGREEEA